MSIINYIFQHIYIYIYELFFHEQLRKWNVEVSFPFDRSKKKKYSNIWKSPRIYIILLEIIFLFYDSILSNYNNYRKFFIFQLNIISIKNISYFFCTHTSELNFIYFFFNKKKTLRRIMLIIMQYKNGTCLLKKLLIERK